MLRCKVAQHFVSGQLSYSRLSSGCDRAPGEGRTAWVRAWIGQGHSDAEELFEQQLGAVLVR